MNKHEQLAGVTGGTGSNVDVAIEATATRFPGVPESDNSGFLSTLGDVLLGEPIAQALGGDSEGDSGQDSGYLLGQLSEESNDQS